MHFSIKHIWVGCVFAGATLMLAACNFTSSEVDRNELTTNVPADSLPVADLQTEKDLVDRRINDKIADIQKYMTKIDSSSSENAIELKTDLTSIQVELDQMLKNIKSDSLFKDSATRNRLQMVEDELMQIGKEIDEIKYKQHKE